MTVAGPNAEGRSRIADSASLARIIRCQVASWRNRIRSFWVQKWRWPQHGSIRHQLADIRGKHKALCASHQLKRVRLPPTCGIRIRRLQQANGFGRHHAVSELTLEAAKKECADPINEVAGPGKNTLSQHAQRLRSAGHRKNKPYPGQT